MQTRILSKRLLTFTHSGLTKQIITNPIRNFQLFIKQKYTLLGLDQSKYENKHMTSTVLLNNIHKSFSSDNRNNDFNLVKTYNDLITKGEIEENHAQNRVINELEEMGDKVLKHVDLLHKYRSSGHNQTVITPSAPKPKENKSSGGLWNLFKGNKDEDSELVFKVPEKIIKTLPSEYKDLENLRGVYLWGSPGTGKTYLMDMFYNELPVKKKRRMHYAEFMLQIHEEEHKVNMLKERTMDTINTVGNAYSNDVEVLCIDEFQVLHISDAMILKRLFEAFFANNIICFVTSNRPPSDLYKNGLQRKLFLPFIDMVTTQMNVVSLDGVDYRTRDITQEENK
jgi:protein AFG1